MSFLKSAAHLIFESGCLTGLEFSNSAEQDGRCPRRPSCPLHHLHWDYKSEPPCTTFYPSTRKLVGHALTEPCPQFCFALLEVYLDHSTERGMRLVTSFSVHILCVVTVVMR